MGRLYLPWAPSLDTIDGGYFGMRLGQSATAGLFAGSTPDPTSWNYNPDQRIAGSFINFQGGSYDHFYYSSTSGLGVSTLKWQINRPFVFFENSVSYKRNVSIYDSLQADSPRGNQAVAAPGPGLSRNFLTVRLQVHPRLELDFNHNYFRDIPTFDPTLIGTGLLDKYLFQGFSVGARAEIVKQVFLYADIGRSNRTGDAKNSLEPDGRHQLQPSALVGTAGGRALLAVQQFLWRRFLQVSLCVAGFQRHTAPGDPGRDARLQFHAGNQQSLPLYKRQC